MTKKDEVFNLKFHKPSDFKFNSDVAGVFDDMVNRSVPFYEEIQRMIAELAAEYVRENGRIYDLGCSTGTSFIHLENRVPPSVTFVGIDDSQDMLDKCREKMKTIDSKHALELQTADLNAEVRVENASVVILCLTLQFVRPIHRGELLRQIFNGMEKGGTLILVEKILAEDSIYNRDFIKFYYEMKKRNDYSELEIAQKREALENVLIPYKLSENIQLLEKNGFSHCEVFFKWYNFAGLIAKKAL